MTNTLKDVGSTFKLKRQEMNLSLKEAENMTSIRTNYLKAIEDGEISKLISPIYAQGFFLQYASFLGLNGEDIVKEHPEIFKNTKNHEFSYGIGTLEVRATSNSGIKWLPNAMWIGISIVLSIVAWFLIKYLQIF